MGATAMCVCVCVCVLLLLLLIILKKYKKTLKWTKFQNVFNVINQPKPINTSFVNFLIHMLHLYTQHAH